MKRPVNIEILSPGGFIDPLLQLGGNDYVPISEEYSKLKSVVSQLAKVKKLPYTILVASTISNEGKSVTSINLAYNLSKDHGAQVVIIDADLRKPSLCRYLNLRPERGLTDCLLGNADLRDVLVPVGEGGNMLLLPAGKRAPNPVELLSPQHVMPLLEQMRSAFPNAYIIIDTSPVLLFAEGRTLSAMVDGVLYVMKIEGASKLHIAEALNSLKDANIIGLVCNMATEMIHDRGYGYYNYYNYYRRESDGGEHGKRRKSGLLSRVFRQ